MNRTARIIVSLLAGIAAALVTLVGLTELLGPYVWSSLMVSGPVAVVTGVLSAVLAFGLLQYREEMRGGGASDGTTAVLGGLVVGVVAFGLAGVAVTLALGAFSVSLFAATLVVGIPAGLLTGVVGAVTLAWYVGRRDDRRGPVA
ncbi:hypothetical protein [Halomicrococcus gelatinilyticus]|uniref:hypothetical protein n=1 Tax=Halomicrococcus gelatinilyticus TaxID=1702103 RepID=UPI002E104267